MKFDFNSLDVTSVKINYGLDVLAHWSTSNHIVVYHNGRYFKVYIYFKHQLLKPCQLEM